MKSWLRDLGYGVQAAALIFVLIVFAWVLGLLAHDLAAWQPPGWLAWIYPGGLV